MLKEMIRSLTNVFKKPHTTQYPFEEVKKPKNYRGLIEYNEEHCIFCDKCEKVCPPNAIHFLQDVNDGSKQYRYNPYLCIYCGECVRECPKMDEALTHSDKKPTPATKLDKVNEEWFEYQKKCREAREEYKINKKRQKEQDKKAKELL